MKRAIRNLVRVVASALVAFGLIDLCLEFFRVHFHEGEIHWSAGAIGLVFILAGILLFVFSAKIAAKIADDFEE